MTCYAAKLGNCSGPITREHYISKSVLEIAGKTVKVTGFPWQEPDETMEIGVSALTANILCRYHNSQLSPIDETGRKFLLALKMSFDNGISGEEFTSEVFAIDGVKLELWLLKILCGIFTNFGDVDIPESWIDILFQKRPFPEGLGMHIFGEPGGATWFFNLVRVIAVKDKNANIAGAKFGIGGIAILLAFGKPKFHENGIQSLYRPKCIEIKKDEGIKQVKILWPENTGKGSILFDLRRVVTDKENFVYKPIVMPNRKKNRN